jgi:TonB family protein
LDSIFVSYRRSDSQGEAGRLFDDLAKSFGEDKVFMDVAAIEAGRDFRKAIEEGVTKCGVLLVLIGLDWLEAKDEHGVQRLADPSDFVRIETASALKRDIPVIPVLVRGARMPAAEQLPDELKELAYRNCIELTHARWKSDVQLLVGSLNRLIGDKNAAAGAARDRRNANATPQATGGVSVAFRTEDLQTLTRELAIFIGPIASVIVKRATAQGGSRDELCGRVAQEIEENKDRQRFLQIVGAEWVKDGAGAPRSKASSGVVPRGDGAVAAAVGMAGAAQRVPSEANMERARDVAAEGQPARPDEGRGSFQKYGWIGLAALVVVIAAVAILMRSAGSRENYPSPEAPKTTVASAGSGENGAAKDVSTPVAETASGSHKPLPKNGEQAENGTPSEAPQPIRVSEETSKTMLIHKVMPVYPVLARQGRIQGMVVLDADVSKEGTVTGLRAVTGNPLLVQTAMEAVKQYRYTPYMQGGKALPMTTQISVNFVLSQQ